MTARFVRVSGPVVVGALLFVTTLSSLLPTPWPGSGDTDPLRAAAVFVAAGLWLVVWAAGAVRISSRLRWWWAGLLALCLIVVSSSLGSAHPLASLLGGERTGQGASFWIAISVVALGASTIRFDSVLRRWISAVYVWVVPVAVWGLWQGLSHQTVTAGFENSNLFDLVLLLWLPTTLGLAATSGKPVERWGWFGVGGLLVAAILFSNGQAAAVAMVAELGLCLAVMGPRSIRSAVPVRAIGLALVSLSVAGMLVVQVAGLLGPGRAPAFSRVLGSSFETRALMWDSARRVFVANPVLGVGPSGYQIASQSFTARPGLLRVERGGIIDLTPDDPHSLAMRLASETGMLGVVAFLMAAVGWALAIRRERAPSEGAASLRDSFWIASVGFMLALLYAPWSLPLGATPAIVIGLGAGAFRSASSSGRGERTWLRWLCATPLFALFIVLAVSRVGWALTFQQAMDSSTPADRLSLLKVSRSYAPWDSTTRFNVLWTEGRLAVDGLSDETSFQRDVDSDNLVGAYAPSLCEFVRLGLEQARSSGRQDLTWEGATLDEAALIAPGLPSIAAERLHLAIVAGDKAAISTQLARSSGLTDLDPYYPQYVQEAKLMLR